MKLINKIKSAVLLTFIYMPLTYANDAFENNVGTAFKGGDVIGGASNNLSLILKIIIYGVGVAALFGGFKSLMHGVDKAKQPDGGMAEVLMGAGVAALVIFFGGVVVYIGGHYTDTIKAITINSK